jgi:hypothetical protein
MDDVPQLVSHFYSSGQETQAIMNETVLRICIYTWILLSVIISR